VANDTAIAVNQGGKRKGAVCAYLETWHIDVEDSSTCARTQGMTAVAHTTVEKARLRAKMSTALRTDLETKLQS
jgi:ribonucleotide reductase alpha subunit